MAEVSNLQDFHQQSIIVQEQDEDPSPIQSLASIANRYLNTDNNIISNSIDINGDDASLFAFDFNPLSPPNMSFFVPSSFRLHNLLSDSDSDSLSETDDSDSEDSDSVACASFFYGEHQLDFVTDLFESRNIYFPEGPNSDRNPFGGTMSNEINIRVSENSAFDDFDLNHVDELGSRIEFDRVAFASNDSSSNGLRIARIESDSDSDEQYAISEYDSDQVSDSDLPIFRNYLGFDNQRTRRDDEELDWEEVSRRISDREGPSSVIDRIEEICVSSDTYTEEEDEIGEEAVTDLEWEVLLAVNNLERNIEFFTNGEFDDYVYATDYYDSVFGHFLESEIALKASPPASKSVIENLPLVTLSKEELGKNNVACAVCKDDIIVEETVTKLPCSHHYHGDCILPWLKIRNTCPVCRFELPTDDAEYEQRKNGDEMQVRFSFENSH